MMNFETASTSRGWIELLAGNSGARIESPGQFVLRVGRQFPEKFLQIEGSLDTPKQCFMNALHLSLERPELRYCEGWAISRNLPMPTEHAWCFDGERIVDPTWHNQGRDYFGVEFQDIGLAMEIATYTGVYGIFSAGRQWRGVLDRLNGVFPGKALESRAS